MNRSVLTLSFGAMLLAGSSGAFAGVLVVRAAGPSAKSYPPGKMLPDSAKVALQNGDTLMLLNANSARTLRGPGTFPVGASGGEALAMAANRRMRFGAMRSGEIPQNPSPWNLDVTQSGKMCIADPAKLVLWRPESDEAVKLTISGPGGKQVVDWAAGKSTAAWPAALKVVNGAEYQLQQEGSSDTSNVTFVSVKDAPSQLQSAAQVLIDNGCNNQLDTLVAKVSD